MSKEKSQYRPILSAVVSLCLSFIVLMLALFSNFSMAWFASNKSVSATDMNISLTPQTGLSIKNYYIYKREGNAEGGSSAKMVSSSGNPQTLKMTEFDPVFTDRNVNTPIIIRIELEDIPEDNPDIEITSTCNNTIYDETTTTNIKSLLSNIIGVRCVQMATPTDSSKPDLNTIDANESETIYSEVSSYFSDQLLNGSEPSSFLTIKSATELKKERILTVTVSDYTPAADRSLTLYMQLDYYDLLVSKYIDTNDIQFTFDIDNETSATEITDLISFDYDLADFAINYKSKK